MTTTVTTSSSNAALVTARVAAGLLGSVQLAGAVFFLFVAPEEAVWVGPWLDVPIVALMLSGMLLKLGVAVLPRLDAQLRITLGFLAVAIGGAVTLMKIAVYDEPEGVLVLGLDAVLLGLLMLAWRGAKR